MYAMLIYIVLGQTAEPYSPIALPYVEQPQLPDNAQTLMLTPGNYVQIVPEEPIYENRTVTKTRPVTYSACGMGCCLVTHQQPYQTEQRICVNDPTPLPAIERILQQTGVRSDDVLVDLGCGDGRVPIIGARVIGCTATGLDNRTAAVALARRNVRLNGMEAKVRIRSSRLDWRDFEDATVVYCYLTPETMKDLRIPTTVRMGISYRHPWPGVKCEQIGDFYIWRRPQKLETAAKRPEVRICAGGS